MHKALSLLLLLGFALYPWTTAGAAQLLNNGDFEIIQLDEFDAPLLDAFGNEQAVAWFRSAGTAEPLTELVNPNNMNNAAGDNAGDDSDGDGVSAMAINFVDDGFGLGLGTDIRSEALETVPGSTVIFSFDFKLEGVPDELAPNVPNGFTAQFRSFNAVGIDGGTAGSFQGEESPAVLAGDFANDVWHSTSYIIEVPAGGTFSDVRISASLFSPPFLSGGRILIDNVQVNELLADFDGNLVVEAADLAVWEASTGIDDDADADGDGDSDLADLLEWQRTLGLGAGAIDPSPDPVLTAAAVPEPSAIVLLAGACAGLVGCGRRVKT